jgi:hypothetical protein
MPPIYRNNALNGTIPISVPVCKKYIKNILSKNPNVEKAINSEINPLEKDNRTKLEQNIKNTSNKIIEIQEHINNAIQQKKELEIELVKLKSSSNSTELPISSNNPAELPISFVDTFTYADTFNNKTIINSMYINLFKVSPLFKELVDNTFVINDIDTFDSDWIKECIDYVSKLSISDKATLLGYTHHGDEYINTYLRYPDKFVNKMIEKLKLDLNIIFRNYNTNDIPIIIKGFPFYSQIFKINKITDINSYFHTSQHSMKEEPIGHITLQGLLKIKEILINNNINNNIKNNDKSDIEKLQKYFEPIIKQFGIDLDNIIKNAPKLNKNIKVFRGVETDYFKSEGIIKGFTSTSILLRLAKSFSKPNNHTNKDRLYENIITMNTPCLFIPPKNTWPGNSGKPEYEVLISPNVIATPSELKFKAFFNPRPNEVLRSFKDCKLDLGGGDFLTRTITIKPYVLASTSGGKRKTYKNKKSNKSKKYTKKHRY